MWATPPGADWPLLLAHAAAATYAGSGRGVLLCVPDAKDVARVDRALTGGAGGGPPRHSHRPARARAPLPRLPGGLPRGPAGGGRHARGRLRAGARPRPRRDLGRRRRPPRRAAGALPPYPRDPAAARRARGHRRCCWAASPGRSRPTTCCARAGPTSSGCRASGSASGSRCGWPGRATPSSPATRSPAARGCPRRCTRWSARGSRAVRCWCRPRGWATPRRWPASAAAPPRAVRLWAARARGRWRSRGRRPRRGAAGAAPTTLPGRAPSAVTAACGRPSSARPAPPRSSAGPSRRRRSARRPRGTPCWPRSGRSRRSWWRRPERSPWPRAATPPSCCSTRG